jgi:hypothetical protein
MYLFVYIKWLLKIIWRELGKNKYLYLFAYYTIVMFYEIYIWKIIFIIH